VSLTTNNKLEPKENTMTNLEKSKKVIDAMDMIETYTRASSRYFREDEEMTFEQYKDHEKKIQECKEIIFNLVMG
jgi:hypothetical protein